MARQDVIDTIKRVAAKFGIDPNLALASATQESGLNPRAVGDNGTSFGLFQLHRGGELGNLTPQQAYDPETNATVALAEFAKVQKKHPDWSPGQIAAAAQRPADRVGYAQRVNALYAKFTGGQAPTGTQDLTGSSSGSTGSTVSPVGLLTGGTDWRALGLELAFVIGGGALIVTGLVTTFSGQIKGAGKALAGAL